MPRFSIIIPCFNDRHTISDTLQSIVAQSMTDWEVICVDNGSSDGTVRLIQSASRKEPRIQLAFSPQKGRGAARNFGASVLAVGDIVVFCDAGDPWPSARLERLEHTFRDPKVDGVFGQVGFFRPNSSGAIKRSPVVAGTLAKETQDGQETGTFSDIAVRRSVFVGPENYDAAMAQDEELAWLLRLTGRGAKILGIPALQTWYRTSPDGLSHDLAALHSGQQADPQPASYPGFTGSQTNRSGQYCALSRTASRTDFGQTTAMCHAHTLVRRFVETALPKAVSRGFFSK